MNDTADPLKWAGDGDLPRFARPLWPLVDQIARAPATVRTKLLVGFLCGALLLLVLGALSLVVIGKMNADMVEMAAHQDNIERSLGMETLVIAQSHYRAMALLTGDETNNAKIVDAKQQFRQDLDAIDQTGSPETRELLDRVRQASDRFDAAGASVLALEQAGQVDAAMARHLNLEHQVSHEVEAAVRQLETELGSARDAEQAQFADKRRLLQASIVGFSGVSVGLALLLGFVFSWALIRAVRRIEAALTDIAAGKVGRQVEIPNRDELGTLAAHLNHMSLELARLYSELRSVNASLEGKNEELGLELAERRRAEAEAAVARDQAIEANRIKSAFLANMSHELRTPLTAIIGFSEGLQEDAEAADDSAILPDLQRIHAAAHHLLQIINDILDLSRLEAGNMELMIEPVDVTQVVDDVVTVLRPLVQRGGNTLQVHCAANVGVIDADLTRLRQVLFNLLSNAGKFTQRGTIGLTVSRETGDDGAAWLALVVSDTGTGMRPEQLEWLFDSFGQTDNAEARIQGGTGLGLAMSQRLCRLMGGEITVSSEYGKGSTFTVRLPACDSRLAAPDAASAGVRAPAVLVVHHDPTVRARLERLLALDGLQVTAAADAEAGLRLAPELHPDVVILDTQSPDGDAWSTLAAIKAEPALAHVAAIMVSLLAEKDAGYVFEASDQDRLPALLNEPPMALPYVLSRTCELALAAVGAAHEWAHPAEAEVSPAPDVVPLAQAKPGTILIVDDNQVNRWVLVQQLEQLGHATLEAANGREALSVLEAASVDLVLCGIMMPEMDGYELLERRLAEPQLCPVPVVMVSPVSDVRAVARCIELGAEDYLTKPFDPVLLRARVSSCLEKKRLRDQEVRYLQQVGRVTDAAAAVEAGTFDAGTLTDLARREDALGRLVRVFQHMVREVYAREQRLRAQVRELRIEIDQTKKDRQVAEITDTDYFRQLQQRARSMRRRAGAAAT
ncbi:MAG TPA: response regulator [Chloroflexota bacterium]|jgi:signal transduction histidine kinase/DNA-binding response OmpR family regulator